MSFTQALSKIQCLSRNQVKYIAMLAMFLRHATLMFIDSSLPLYSIITGTLNPLFHFSFPMFAMFSIEGMTRTHHMTRNLCLLAIFGVITEPLFDLYFYGTPFALEHQNILWTYLAYGLFYLACKKSEMLTQSSFSKYMRYAMLIVLAAIMIIVAGITNIDYGACGLLGMMLAYLLYRKTKSLPISMLAIVVIQILLTGSFFWLFGVGFMLLYKPDKPCSHTKVQKYLGYAFYPGHLAILTAIKAVVLSGISIALF